MKPVILLTKTWCGNLSYDRIEGRNITHGLEFDGALPRRDVERFRVKPAEFIAELAAEAEEPVQDAQQKASDQ